MPLEIPEPDETSPEYIEPKEEFMELLEEVQHIPDWDRLSKLKNDRSVKRLVEMVNAIIKVVLPEEPDLTAINQLQYTGGHLISSKIEPR